MGKPKLYIGDYRTVVRKVLYVKKCLDYEEYGDVPYAERKKMMAGSNAWIWSDSQILDGCDIVFVGDLDK